ncbi:tripartite tricarboxylate transporter substrate-binding protein [Alkalilacustris brevis]|uniref:tripartite tricarboxylate transporter substrate-binding protein n=1 Tax=Alkalilacustris brevis TaxID=2026338 RepID=UPI00138FACF0|nr:tripartite tricarboxylate transporter substrate-binding protein [Alkalilacustris brevis]
MLNFTRRTTIAAGAAALMIAAAPNAEAQSVEDIYSGQTLTILIGHPPGGSYDLYAQLAAAYFGDFVPGNPNVIVQHMPGGGGRQGAAYFINNTQPDGLTVAILPDTLGHIELLSPDIAAWSAEDFRYVGRFANANAAFLVRAGAPATTIEEMRDTEIVVGCTGQGARSGQQPTAMRNVAGLKLRVICGYQGSAATELATLRGEVDMVTQNYASVFAAPEPVDSGEMIIVLQAGLQPDPNIPDVPLMQDVVEDEEAKEILRFISAASPVGRSMMVHPDTDEEIIAALRTAFEEMIHDPDFLAEAERRQALIDYMPGEEVEAIMQDIMSVSPELLEKAVSAMDDSDAEVVAQ